MARKSVKPSRGIMLNAVEGRRQPLALPDRLYQIPVQRSHVRDTVTVGLPPATRRQLDRIAAQEGVSRSDVLQAALEDHLFVRRFRALQQRMMAAAQARGIFTGKDVFDLVS